MAHPTRLTPLVALLSLLGAAAACSAPAGNATAQIDSSAKVSARAAHEAFVLVDGIDYLPFAYKEDGCYARALYMSMELAAAGIPSSAQYITGKLSPGDNQTWSYHVAPMLQIGQDTFRTILDPSIEAGPVKLHDWIDHLHPAGVVKTFFVPGSVYINSVNTQDPSQNFGPMVTSFDELPPFHKADIADACRVMWNYLDWETPAHDELRPKLIARTAELMTALDDRGKLTDYAPGDTVACDVPMDP